MGQDTWLVGTIHLWRQLLSTSFVNIGDWKRVDGFDLQDWITHNYPSVYHVISPDFTPALVDWVYLQKQLDAFEYPREISYRNPSTVYWLGKLADTIFDWQHTSDNAERRFGKRGLHSLVELAYVSATEPGSEVITPVMYWSDWLTIFQWQAQKYLDRRDDDRWNYGGQALSYSWAANFLGASALLMKKGIRPTSHMVLFGNEVQDATASGN